MGKSKDIESLIRLMVNTIVHEIVIRHTNKPESRHFLGSEVVEYRGQTEKISEQHNWNDKDKERIRESVLEKIKEKLSSKYLDVSFSMHEAKKLVEEEIKNLGL